MSVAPDRIREYRCGNDRMNVGGWARAERFVAAFEFGWVPALERGARRWVY